MDVDHGVVSLIREVVIEAENYRLRAARTVFGMGVTEMIALSHLFVQGSSTPTELARRLEVTTPSVTELVDRLSRAGLVDRGPHPTDRRKVIITLTGSARDTIGPTFGVFGHAVSRCSARLDGRDREVVMGFLRELADEIATIHPTDTPAVGPDTGDAAAPTAPPATLTATPRR